MPEINLEINNTHHWNISFEVLLDKEKARVEDQDIAKTLEETDFWVADEVVVAGTDDASPLVDQVKNWVMNTESTDNEYPLPVIGFRLTGIELLSIAEI